MYVATGMPCLNLQVSKVHYSEVGNLYTHTVNGWHVPAKLRVLVHLELSLMHAAFFRVVRPYSDAAATLFAGTCLQQQMIVSGSAFKLCY